MKIGITGSTGVLGTLLNKKLVEKGFEVVPYTSDIRDYKALSEWLSHHNVTHLIHLAAKVAIDKVEKNVTEAIDVNIGGVLNLVKAIQNYGHLKFLFFASSSHVYATKSGKIKEDDRLAPLNLYGSTKLIGEQIIQLVSRQLNLSVCIGRIFSFYHDSQKGSFLYPNLKKRILEENQEEPFVLFGALNKRDFLPADIVADKIVKLTECEYQGIINIGSGSATSILKFARNLLPKNRIISYDKSQKWNSLVANIDKLTEFENRHEKI